MKIELAEDVKIIIEMLQKNGHEAYVVGGAIRDILYGFTPKDWDIGTSASPEEIIECFTGVYRIFEKGIQHGTVGLIYRGREYELTTFRIDKDYIDNRRPSDVEFTRSLEEDLKRRDFTINAMAYNDRVGLVDLFGGREDMERRIVRAVGDPYKRFEEDALRIMRGIRLARELRFHIEKNTYNAMVHRGELIKNISSDRIRDELTRILLAEKPSLGMMYLVQIKMLKYIIPELDRCIGFEQKSPHHTKDVFGHILDVLDNTRSDIVLRLSALLHDVGKPDCFSLDEKGVGHFYGHNDRSSEIAQSILTRLNYSKKIREKVVRLIRYHMSIHDFDTDASVKRFVNKLGEDNIAELIDLQLADKTATNSMDSLNNIVKLKEKYDKILESKPPMKLKDLEVDGNDVKKMGVSEGVLIGKVLNELLERVIEDPRLDQEKELEVLVQNNLKK